MGLGTRRKGGNPGQVGRKGQPGRRSTQSAHLGQQVEQLQQFVGGDQHHRGHCDRGAACLLLSRQGRWGNGWRCARVQSILIPRCEH